MNVRQTDKRIAHAHAYVAALSLHLFCGAKYRTIWIIDNDRLACTAIKRFIWIFSGILKANNLLFVLNILSESANQGKIIYFWISIFICACTVVIRGKYEIFYFPKNFFPFMNHYIRWSLKERSIKQFIHPLTNCLL